MVFIIYSEDVLGKLKELIGLISFLNGPRQDACNGSPIPSGNISFVQRTGRWKVSTTDGQYLQLDGTPECLAWIDQKKLLMYLCCIGVLPKLVPNHRRIERSLDNRRVALLCNFRGICAHGRQKYAYETIGQPSLIGEVIFR